MDWLAVTSELLAKKKEECEEKGEEFSSINGVLDQSEKIESSLSPFEADALCHILETASLQLHIIDGTCSSSPSRSNVIARRKIMEVIEETEKEIREKGTFEVLYKKTKEEAESIRNAQFLQDLLKHNQIRVQDLKSSLKGHELAKLMEMNEKQEIIASLKDKIHEEIAKNDVWLRYVDKWETARQSQCRMRCQIAEKELEKKIEEMIEKVNNEIRVHDEICTFLALEEQRLLQEVEKWKEAYHLELKMRNEKIKTLENKRKEQQILFHELNLTYEAQRRGINDYLEFKRKLHIEQEQIRYINKMATKIQAWWKGTMVRRGLGPYKKKKKFGKEKKKK